MEQENSENKFVLMVVYNAIQYDARVIRAAETINNIGEKVIVISCNSDNSYENKRFDSFVFNSNLKGPFLLIAFWVHILRFSFVHKKEIKLIYLHDYFLVILGKLIGKLNKTKWVYDAHELVLDHRKNITGKRAWFFTCMEKLSIKSANLVVTANQERTRILKSVYKLKNVISILNISPKNKLTQDETIREDIIVYQGMLSEERSVSNLIKMLEFLPNHIKLKLIGDGPDLPYYKEMVQEMRLGGRVIFTGKIPYSKLFEESKSCKVGIVVYKLEGLNNYYCSPNKIYEYAQLNIPMLMSPQPFLKNICTKYKIGDLIHPDESIEDKATKALRIINNFDLYVNGMNAFLSDYSYEKEMDKLKAGIVELLDERA